MAYRETVQKNFEEREYRHVAVVRHQGTVVAFALGANRRFYYAVLDQDVNTEHVHGASSSASTSLDVFGWPSQPSELIFPGEKSSASNVTLNPVQIPFVALNSNQEIEVADQEGTLKNIFQSSTARLTAVAPFQVLSDGKYIYLFRQSVAKEHKDALFLTTSGGASAAPDAAYEKDKSVPLVDEAVLVDRFVLSNGSVVGKKEVRYRRSRNRHTPADSKDSLGAVDMDQKEFYEPTTELDFFRSVQLGRFVVLLVPTAVADLYRWQFYVVNKLTGLMEGYSVERAANGLFNTEGTTLYVCPGHEGVVERGPGKCPDGKTDLVPKGSKQGSAHAAVELGGKDVRIAIRDKFYKATREISHITVAAWVKMSDDQPAEAEENQHTDSWEMVKFPGRSHDTPSQNSDSNTLLSFDAKSYYSVGVENGNVVWSTASVSWRYDTHHVMRGKKKVNDGSWHHVAVTYESGTGRKAIVVDGEIDVEHDAVHGGELLGRGGNRYGFIGIESNASTYDGERGGGAFKGVVDELSLWQVALSPDVLDKLKSKRLTGTEAGLEALWHFDEESGSVVREQSGQTTFHADIKPKGADVWVVSDAPIGELSGIRRNMFEAEGFRFASGPSAVLYYQQEDAVSGYQDAASKSVKTDARIMVAIALENDTTKPKLGVLDMGLSALGETALPPTAFQLKSIKNPIDQKILENLKGKIDAEWNKVSKPDFGTMSWAPRLMDEDSKLVMHVPSADKLLKTYGLEFSATISLDDMERNHGPLITLKLGTHYAINIEMHFNTFKAVVSHALRDGNGGQALDLSPPIADKRKQREWYRVFVAVSPLTSYVEIRLHDFETVRIGIKKEDFGFPEWMVGGFKGRIADARMYTRNPVDANSTSPPFGSIFVKNKYSPSYSEPAGLNKPDIMDMYRAGGQLGTVHTHGEILWGITGSKPEYDDLYNYIAEYENLVGFKQTTMFPIQSHSKGLSFVGGYLEFADVFKASTPANVDSGSPAGDPYLFSSAEGMVRMYWMGPEKDFMAAEFDPSGTRSVYSVETSTGINVDFRARHLEAGEHSIVSIEDGTSEEFCKLTVKDAALNAHEIWEDMPRDLNACAQILEGGIVRTYVGKVASEKQGELEFKAAPQAVLRKGYTLLQKNLRVKITADPHPSSTKVSVDSQAVVGFKQGEPVHVVAYDYNTNAHPASIFSSLAGGSHAITMPFRGKGTLKNGKYEAEGGTPPQWVLRNSVYSFPWGDMYASGEKSKGSKGWVTEGDMCMEAWIKPNLNTEALLLSNVDVKGGTYCMGASPEQALGFDGKNSYVNVGGSVNTAFEDGITIEAWVNFQEFQHNSSILDLASLTGSDGIVLGNVAKSDLLRFACRQGGRDVVSIDLVHLKDWKEKWVHIAIVYDQTDADKGACRMYINGALVTPVNVRACGKIPKVKWASTFLGRSNVNGNELFKGAMDEVRLWSTPRSAADIIAFRRQRVKEHSKLIQAWRANDSQQIAGIQANSPSWSFFACVGGVQRRAYQVTPGDQWTHVAASYKQSYACGFDGISSSAVCNAPTGNLLNMTLEVYFQLDRAGAHGLLSKGSWDNPDKIGVDFALYVEENSRLMFVTQESGTDSIFMFDTGFDVEQGVFYKIAISREVKKENGALDLRYAFYLNSFLVGSAESQDMPGDSKNSPIQIGGFSMDGQHKRLHGSISEIRLWDVALGANMIGKPVSGKPPHLKLWLQMEEGVGKVAHDSVGSNHASLKNVKWIHSPDSEASYLDMYIDGNKQQIMEQGEVEVLGGFNLGKGYRGSMQEVRIWNTARTQEQIIDNMFTGLKGELESLVAYYQGPNMSATEFKDSGLRGNDLKVINEGTTEILHEFSNCPVGNDIVEVQPAARLILGSSAKNHFVEGIDSRPCVTEYGDLQTNGVHRFGVHKRCYTTIKDGVWQLYTGLKVGSLKTEWVGQAQGHADLVGFIEGAPPVPSENLTKVGSDYNGLSSVTLSEPSEVNYIYASSKEEGHWEALQASASDGGDVPNEAGVSLQDYKGEFNTEPCDSSVREANVEFGRRSSKAGDMRLTGAWEPEHSPDIMAIGRRFIPKNIGVALVESCQVDVYALRMEHNNALVAYRRLPSTEVPSDRMFIRFPINRQYTKSGTLDGKVGLEADKDYKHAAVGGEWSYYKPKESARLKKKIARQKAELELQYGQGKSTHSNSLKPAVGRNIVNTYTWTATGGFLAESTEVMDSRVEAIASTCSLKMVGDSTAVSGPVFGEAMNLEARNLDAMEGGQLVCMTSKKKGTSNGASLDVVIAGEHDVVKDAEPAGLREYLGHMMDLDVPDNGDEEPMFKPGKVDAYRFNTFYLETSKDNAEDFFNKVVDPTWLDQSPSANAQVLRSAMTKPTYAWRIMHRVTFVSRVLPEVHPHRESNTIHGALRAEHMESDWELVKRLKPFVSSKAGCPADFDVAVQDALERYIPRLKPFYPQVLQHCRSYFEVEG